MSDTVVSSTGAPRGTVLAPLLFTLYTADFSSQSCDLQKFSGDSAIVDITTNQEGSEYRGLIFVDWCYSNDLQINVGKSKESVNTYRESGLWVLP